jgi:hypothetical protein
MASGLASAARVALVLVPSSWVTRLFNGQEFAGAAVVAAISSTILVGLIIARTSESCADILSAIQLDPVSDAFSIIPYISILG